MITIFALSGFSYHPYQRLLLFNRVPPNLFVGYFEKTFNPKDKKRKNHEIANCTLVYFSFVYFGFAARRPHF